MNLGEFRKKYRYDPVTDLLGKGGFGTVYKAYDMVLKKHRALKFFTRDADAADGSGKYDLVSEIERAIDFRHDNICRYYGADILETVNEHGVQREMQVGIMELVPGGHLNEYVYRHPEHVESLLVDVLRGLSYLHTLHPPIIHRDLKPGNVLVAIDDVVPVAKITDFGISRTIDAGREGVSKVGTYDYMAPEQIFPQKFGVHGGVGTNVDLWSFGVLVYELLTGELPFAGDDPKASQGRILEAIVSGVPEATLERFPDPYRTVLKRCLVQYAGERAQTADELIAIFRGFAGQAAGRVTEPWVFPPPRSNGPNGPNFSRGVSTSASDAGRGTTSVDLLVSWPRSGGGSGLSSGRGGGVTELEQLLPPPLPPPLPPLPPPVAKERSKTGMIAGVMLAVLAAVGMATYPLWHKPDSASRQIGAASDGTTKTPLTGDAPLTPTASLTVRCSVACNWTVNGLSAAVLPVGADGRYLLPANVTARIVARAASGAGATQEKTVTPRAGGRVDLQFVFGANGPDQPKGDATPGGDQGATPTNHTEIDSLLQTGYDKQVDDDLPGAYKAYSTAEALSKDGYKRQEASKSKDNVLAACRDRGISCFGK